MNKGLNIWGRDKKINCPHCNGIIEIHFDECATCIDNKVITIKNLKNEIVKLKEKLNEGKKEKK